MDLDLIEKNAKIFGGFKNYLYLCIVKHIKEFRYGKDYQCHTEKDGIMV